MRVSILHGVPVGAPLYGGAEAVRDDLPRALRDAGLTVSYGCDPDADVVQVLSIQHNLELVEQVRRVLDAGRARVVWSPCDHWPFCQNQNALWPAARRCAGIDGPCDDACPSRRSLSWPATRELCRSVVVAWSVGQARMLRLHGIRVDAICALGVDTALFRVHDRDWTSPMRIGFVGAFARYPTKGGHVLAAALRRTGLNASVVTGLKREQVAEMYGRFHIVTVPSIYEETWGLCCTEAMSSGACVVATKVSGYLDQIEHGETGLLVEPDDPEDLAECLRWIMARPELAQEIGRRAADYVRKNNTLAHMAERYIAVYRGDGGGDDGPG